MKRWMDRLLTAAKRYNIWDYGFLKITLFSFGIIIGAYFPRFFLSYINIIWAIFIAAYLWIIYKTFVRYWN